MANGSGVSVGRVGDRWRVRWREAVEVDGARAWKQRERMVSSEQAAIDLRSVVLRAIETAGFYVDPARVLASVPTVEALGIGYIRSLSSQGLEPSTIESKSSRLIAALKTLRAIEGLPAGAPVPCDVLSRDVVAAGVAHDRARGIGELTIRGRWSTLIEVWGDGYEARHGVGVPIPIRHPKTVLPRNPKRVAPPAPTMIEVDACIRQLPPQATKAVPCAIIMRYTGLRISQTMALKRGNLDLGRMLLTVWTGKSEREKAEAAAGIRQIPVTQAFLADLAPYLGEDPKGPLFKWRKNARKGTSAPGHTLRAAWEAATEAGEVRREVWAPPDRGNARPDHAFRAALLSHLKGASVDREIRAAVVGQHDNVETRHYADHSSLLGAMRTAMELVPPIDWIGVRDVRDNVVELRASGT